MRAVSQKVGVVMAVRGFLDPPATTIEGSPAALVRTDPEYRKEWLDTDIPCVLNLCVPVRMVLGFPKDRSIGMVIGWWHRPYYERDAEARKDYDRLRLNILEHGVLAPLIGWRHPETGRVHILVGMRRAEIVAQHALLVEMGGDVEPPPEALPVALVQEDIRLWWKFDAQRQDRLKAELGEVKY